MSLKKCTLSFILFAVALNFLASCDTESEDSHDLTVAWNISGLPVCKAFLPKGNYATEDVQFSEVKINIFEDETGEEAVQAPVVAACDKHTHQITRLARGSYFVTIEAITEYEGEKLSFFAGKQEVKVPADDNRVDIPLAVGDGQIQVVWQFESGLICGVEKAGEIASIMVKHNGDEVELPCGDGQLIIEEVYPDNNHTLSAQGLSKEGYVLYETEFSTNPFEVLPGQTFTAELMFK